MKKLGISQALMIFTTLGSGMAQAQVALGNLEHKSCTMIRSASAPKLETDLSVDGFHFRNCTDCEPLVIAPHFTEGLKKLQKMGLQDTATTAIYDYTNSCVVLLQVRGDKVDILSSAGASGGRGGVGNELKSGRTPLGVHRTALSSGEAPRIAKTPLNGNLDPGHAGYSNPIVVPTLDPVNWPTDFVLSRFIRLQGLEPALNSNSVARKILFHGTHEEGLLGYDESGGCIRMANKDVILLFNDLPLGSLVNIVAAPGQKASRYGNHRMKHYDETQQLGPKKGGR